MKCVWSRITSHATVKWSQVKSNVTKSTTVDLGSISASSRVMFLYRSDSQVYMLYMMTRQQFKQLPQKLTILVWRFVFLMVLLFYLHFIYVTIRMHLCSICNRRTTDVRYDMMWYDKTASVSVTHTHTLPLQAPSSRHFVQNSATFHRDALIRSSQLCCGRTVYLEIWHKMALRSCHLMSLFRRDLNTELFIRAYH